MSEKDTTYSAKLDLPEGDKVRLKVEPNGRHVFSLEHGRGAAHYHQEQVEALGEGNVAIGVVNILSRILSDSEKFFAPANVMAGSAEEIQEQNTIRYPAQPLQLDR